MTPLISHHQILTREKKIVNMTCTSLGDQNETLISFCDNNIIASLDHRHTLSNAVEIFCMTKGLSSISPWSDIVVALVACEGDDLYQIFNVHPLYTGL